MARSSRLRPRRGLAYGASVSSQKAPRGAAFGRCASAHDAPLLAGPRADPRTRPGGTACWYARLRGRVRRWSSASVRSPRTSARADARLDDCTPSSGGCLRRICPIQTCWMPASSNRSDSTLKPARSYSATASSCAARRTRAQPRSRAAARASSSIRTAMPRRRHSRATATRPIFAGASPIGHDHPGGPCRAAGAACRPRARPLGRARRGAARHRRASRSPPRAGRPVRRRTPDP